MSIATHRAQAGGIALRAIIAASTIGLAACASHPRVVEVGSPLMLTRDAPVALPDRSTLTYAGLRDDSRCPPRVMCIHAGSVTLDFRYAPAGGTARVVSIQAPRALSVNVSAAWRLTLVDLDGANAAGVKARIDPGD